MATGPVDKEPSEVARLFKEAQILNTITHKCFFTDTGSRTRLSALLDVYTTLSDASKAQQNLQLLPWERQERFDAMLEDLSLKLASLPRAKKSRGRLDSEGIRDVLAEGDEEDKEARWPNLCRHQMSPNMVSLMWTVVIWD